MNGYGQEDQDSIPGRSWILLFITTTRPALWPN